MNKGRVFIQCSRLMTDNDLADVLAQYDSAVRAKSLQSKASDKAKRARRGPSQALLLIL
jgi:hypothetical protein